MKYFGLNLSLIEWYEIQPWCCCLFLVQV